MTEQNNVSLNPKAPEQGERLHRGLSNRHIQLIAIGGAIGTGLFMGSGRAISLAGPSVIFVYMLIGAVIFLVLRAMGEILLSNLRYKSFSDFTTDLVGPMAGFFLGWSYWFMWVVTAVADIIAIVGYLRLWWPDLQAWIPALVVIGVLLTLNLVSVKNFGEIEFWFSMIKIVAIVALIIVGGGMVAIGVHGLRACRYHRRRNPGPRKDPAQGNQRRAGTYYGLLRGRARHHPDGYPLAPRQPR